MKCPSCKNDLSYYPGSQGQSLHCIPCKMIYNTGYMKQTMNKIIMTKYYDGSIESLEEVVDSYNLKPGSYHFDLRTRVIHIYKPGFFLHPGDAYQYFIPETFEAIG